MKAWAVAAMFGTAEDGQALVATWFADSAEIASAQVVSAYHQQAPAPPLPLITVAVRELTVEWLEDALKISRESDRPPLRLVVADRPTPPEAS